MAIGLETLQWCRDQFGLALMRFYHSPGVELNMSRSKDPDRFRRKLVEHIANLKYIAMELGIDYDAVFQQLPEGQRDKMAELISDE